jgi:hypothetical protein
MPSIIFYCSIYPSLTNPGSDSIPFFMIVSRMLAFTTSMSVIEYQLVF